MFGIGETELVLIALFAFMIFGPDKLPGMGRTLGRALRQFRNAQEGFTEVVQTNIVDPAAEAMSDNPKRPTRRRSEELEEDSDIEGEGGTSHKRTETFAERKKRLAEEKLAREKAEKEAAAAASAAAADPDDEDADLSDAAATDVAAPEAADKPSAKPAAPATPASKPSAADLYSMKRPSRSAEPAADAEVSLGATREASEERSDERGATEGDLGTGEADNAEKEA